MSCWGGVVQVFAKDIDQDTVILLGARASRVENQDAIDACIVGMLADAKEVVIKSSIKFNLLIILVVEPTFT